MRKIRYEWKNIIKGMRFYALVLLVFLILALISLHILQNELLKNAMQTGENLARSYSEQEAGSISTYQSILQIGAKNLERMVSEGADHDTLEEYLHNFFGDADTFVQNRVVEPYAVVDGALVGTLQWDGRDTYDYESTAWYRLAIEADGEPICTDAYRDVVYDIDVVTAAMKFGEGADVIAIDIYPQKFRTFDEPLDLPEGGSYFLCDSSGTLLYDQTEYNADWEQKQNYIDWLLGEIGSGDLNESDSFIYDFEGRQRAVYYSISETGWYSIVTVPYATIFGDLLQLTIVFGAVFVLLFLLTLLISIFNYRLNRRAEITNETVRILGNSYYAIYRVDFGQGTYHMIKGSDYVRERLPVTGDYERFLEVVSGIIEKSACEEFLESFSLESICRLVKKRVRDYGGDFLRLFNGEYRWVNVRLLFDESLRQDEAVICFREIEKEKQAWLQQIRLFETALDRARKNEASQKRFFSSMSHDMRTPLNAIISMSELASVHVEDTEKTKDYLNKIHFSSQQLLGLINDILELSRLENSKLDLSMQSFNLRKCIRECAEVFEMQAKQSGKEFTLTFDLVDEVVLGDPFRLTQVLNNLISNAMKFTKKGGSVHVEVCQVEYSQHAKYQFVITDTGRGMSKEFLERIFEPYERETRFGENNVPGTGLGMSIVKSIVSQMDGEISVESTPGKGSVFTVTLPLETAQETETGSVAADEKEEKQECFALGGLRILLAEDNDLNMEIATELLTMQGVNVTQAWNGREAVEAFAGAEEGFFDAILMDMQMPEMDGCEAARTIRRMDRSDAGSIPIIAVTANAFAEDFAATTEAGMDAHISKPIDVKLLYGTLDRLIHKKSKETE